jgi:hypothetical protein
MDLREQLRRSGTEPPSYRRKPHALALIDALFINPYVTIKRAAETLETSQETARQTVLLLTEKGLLQEVSGPSWARVWLAAPILEAIEHLPG